jgi:signal transduction histidine kinase
LYIVKGLVEAQGGTITVGRAPGGGAEFRFILPAGAPAA